MAVQWGGREAGTPLRYIPGEFTATAALTARDAERAPPAWISTTRFTVHLRQHRIRFGESVAAVLPQELSTLAVKRPLLISSERGAAVLESLIHSSGTALPHIAVFTQVLPHVPNQVAQEARRMAVSVTSDCLLAFGGGSALDTAKAVAHELRLPIVAIPTTLSGSEVTFNFGLTVDGVKQTIVDPLVLPATVIYDPSLFASLAPAETVCSGINAIAHATEALYSQNANALTTAIALAGIDHLLRGLRRHRIEPGLDATTKCIYGAWLCGEALAQVGMGLHHRLCHVLGGTFGLPHARTHAVMLPYVVAFNLPGTEALDPLHGLYGCEDVAIGMAQFGKELGAPTCLRDLGLPHAAIGRAAELTLATPIAGPQLPSKADVLSILERAWSGAGLRD